MVRTLINITLIIVLAVVTIANAREFWQMGDVTNIQDNDVFLLRRPGFHPYSGARNISGLWLKQALTTAGPQGGAGYDGNDGVNGTNGINGATGPQGPQGFRGYSGAQGPVGPMGPEGPPGPEGPAATVTQSAVLGVIDDPTDGAELHMRQGPTEASTVAKFHVDDRGGNVRNYIDGSGYQAFKDANGYAVVSIAADTGVISARNSANKLIYKLDPNDTVRLTMYRGDGTTPMFEVYTSGRMVHKGELIIQ